LQHLHPIGNGGQRGVDARDIDTTKVHGAAAGDGDLAAQCNGLLKETFGVKLFNSVDVYQQSERSIKYALIKNRQGQDNE
jgi:inner membrane protein involved in colicin E2 resistance